MILMIKKNFFRIKIIRERFRRFAAFLAPAGLCLSCICACSSDGSSAALAYEEEAAEEGAAGKGTEKMAEEDAGKVVEKGTEEDAGKVVEKDTEEAAEKDAENAAEKDADKNIGNEADESTDNKADEKELEEVKQFVIAFYEGHTKEGMDSLGDYIEDKENLDMYAITYEVAFAYGFQKLDNIDVYVYPLEQDGYWGVFVYSEMIVEGLEVGLPGASTHIVHKGADGNYYIITYVSDSEFLKEIAEEVKQILLQSDEVIEKNAECGMRFNEILLENQEIMEWTMDLLNAVNQAQEELVAQAGTGTETPGGQTDDSYTVQKGDCLWSIAKDQLGDGMYWGEIYEQNKSVIGKNPDLLYDGTQLQIP